MKTGLSQRIAAGALAGCVGGALAAGALLAQTPGAPTGGNFAPQSIFGMWASTPECQQDAFVLVLGPRIMLSSFGQGTARALVTNQPAPEGIQMTTVRHFVLREGRWDEIPSVAGNRSIVQLRGTTLHFLRVIEPDGRERPANPQFATLHPC